MHRSLVSRRALLAAPLAAVACGRRKATAYAGYAFIANEGSRSLSVVDLTRFATRWHIPLDAAPQEILAHPSRPLVYVLSRGSGTLYEIDATALKVRRKLRAGASAVTMRYAPDGRSLWLLCREPSALIRVPLEGFHPDAHIGLPAAPADFDISRDGLAAVCFAAHPQIVLAGSATASRAIEVDEAVSAVRFRSDGLQLLAAQRERRALTVIETASGKTIVRLPLPIEPLNFCFSGDGGQLFISGTGMDAVSIVYPYSTEVAETILAGRMPAGMATNAAVPYLLVANPQSNTVTVLDIETRKLMAVVGVGEQPRAILITPDNQYALVMNRASDDVAVIRIASLAARRYKTAPLFTMVPAGTNPVAAAVVAIS